MSKLYWFSEISPPKPLSVPTATPKFRLPVFFSFTSTSTSRLFGSSASGGCAVTRASLKRPLAFRRFSVFSISLPSIGRPGWKRTSRRITLSRVMKLPWMRTSPVWNCCPSLIVISMSTSGSSPART